MIYKIFISPPPIKKSYNLCVWITHKVISPNNIPKENSKYSTATISKVLNAPPGIQCIKYMHGDRHTRTQTYISRIMIIIIIISRF